MAKAKETVQGLARDIIIDIGDTYHKGCELLSAKPRSEHWDKVGSYLEAYPAKIKLQIKTEIMRLANGWKAVYKNA
jgi:hypothetical protein